MPPRSLCTGERNPIRIPWAKRLHRPIIITAKTAIECDDIVVLALYSQLARRSRARRHNTATLSLHPDVPSELRARIRSLYEESKKTIWHQDQTQQGLLKATTALFAEIWESSRELLVNLHGVYGARKALRWCFDAYCILQAPWSVVSLKVLPLGPEQTRGFGIAASVPLTAKEYIYELAGLISVDGNAEHTRLSEYEATDKTIRLLIGPLRMVNHDCNPNAEYLPVDGSKSALKVRTLRDIAAGEEITFLYSADYFEDEGICPCRTCQGPHLPMRSGPPLINEEERRAAQRAKSVRENARRRERKAERRVHRMT
ncbi:hypothetical protein B0H14DRAFT_3143865 [Mycena olivaceomarginata]|nr:hypothetical protein B0H14DRAFT_3143865 [Mycena olivaceomarginata]